MIYLFPALIASEFILASIMCVCAKQYWKALTYLLSALIQIPIMVAMKG